MCATRHHMLLWKVYVCSSENQDKPALNNILIGGERFSGLTLLSIYRDVEVDLEAVIDIFASKDNRRVNFTHPDLTFKPDTYWQK